MKLKELATGVIPKGACSICGLSEAECAMATGEMDMRGSPEEIKGISNRKFIGKEQ